MPRSQHRRQKRSDIISGTASTATAQLVEIMFILEPKSLVLFGSQPSCDSSEAFKRPVKLSARLVCGDSKVRDAVAIKADPQGCLNSAELIISLGPIVSHFGSFDLFKGLPIPFCPDVLKQIFLGTSETNMRAQTRRETGSRLRER